MNTMKWEIDGFTFVINKEQMGIFAHGDDNMFHGTIMADSFDDLYWKISDAIRLIKKG